jgi:two-component system response regulator YesN
MNRVLLVDDEIFAVKGIVSGVHWGRLGVSEVLEAYHAERAKQILMETPIDIVVCDIEMPEENGLELVQWINLNKPDVISVFLTCHADFSFARKAIQLGSYDYLLKPVIFSELESVLECALRKSRERREKEKAAEKLLKYESIWEDKKAERIERFWHDILSQRLLAKDSVIQEAISEYQLPISHEQEIVMILVKIEKSQASFHERDDEAAPSSLSKLAEELILDKYDGQLVENHEGNMVILLYVDERSSFGNEELKEACKAFIIACNQSLYAGIWCYIGEKSALVDIVRSYHTLLDWDRRNSLKVNHVFSLQDKMEVKQIGSSSTSFLDWTVWLDKGDFSSISILIDEKLVRWNNRAFSVEQLHDIYYGFLQAVYEVLQKNGIPAERLMKDGLLPEVSIATRNLAELSKWMKRMAAAVISLLFTQRPSNPIVQKIKEYIEQHLHVDISRDDLADYVYLHPDYLSRLFRKETGRSLSDYILQERMKKAANLLLHSNEPVSQIALNLGYGNFSHFARMFKRIYGITPLVFRKK